MNNEKKIRNSHVNRKFVILTVAVSLEQEDFSLSKKKAMRIFLNRIYAGTLFSYKKDYNELKKN